jgi:hypothetical protein
MSWHAVPFNTVFVSAARHKNSYSFGRLGEGLTMVTEENRARMTGMTEQSHFVPQGYLKGWSADGKRAWMYRLLVSTDAVPEWRKRSIRGIAFHQHLYTRLAAGTETDEIEKWLNQEFETPAQQALDSVRQNSRLTPTHWKALAHFVAAQHVRTPARYFEMMQRWTVDLKPMIETTLRSSVATREQIRHKDTPLTPLTPTHEAYLPSRVTVRKSAAGGGEIGLEMVAGRGLWLFAIRHLLTSTLRALENHKWTVLNAPSGVEWMTSDDPVIPLNYYAPGRYDFKGGWGNKGTEILLPLSPHHLLYTRVGHRDRPQRDVEPSIAKDFQRFIAEHAHRALFAVRSTSDVENIRPRVVDRVQYEHETQMWNRWHEEQTRAELELQADRPSEIAPDSTS